MVGEGVRPKNIGVCEIFLSIQGEGVNAGLPSVLLRTSGCDLRCRWCDTKYAWNEGTSMTVGEITARVRSVAGSIRRLVITGGEPLLWREPLEEMIASLADFSIEVETNGRHPPMRSRAVTYNVSPKLSNSGEPYEKRIDLSVLEAYARIGSFFKFVVRGEEDLPEVMDIVGRLSLRGEQVILMPLGSTREEIRSRAESVIMACIRTGFRYSPRLQIEHPLSEGG